MRPLIREAFSRTPNGMGYRQVAMALRVEQGLSASDKTILKLMREEDLICQIRRKRWRLLITYLNLLDSRLGVSAVTGKIFP